jgi:hypothetical protein
MYGWCPLDQQSKPQATTAMVFSFACVLVFVVVSTPGTTGTF